MEFLLSGILSEEIVEPPVQWEIFKDFLGALWVTMAFFAPLHETVQGTHTYPLLQMHTDNLCYNYVDTCREVPLLFLELIVYEISLKVGVRAGIGALP